MFHIVGCVTNHFVGGSAPYLSLGWHTGAVTSVILYSCHVYG